MPVQKKSKAKKVSTPKSDPDRWRTTEEALTRDLSEDFLDAWKTLRRYAADLGPQRIYASGKAIIFCMKVNRCGDLPLQSLFQKRSMPTLLS